MKRVFKAVIAGGVLALGAAFAFSVSLASAPGHACVSVKPAAPEDGIGYELISLLHWEAWVSTEWRLDEYLAFSPHWTSPQWRKNEPRHGMAARTWVMKSPNCPNPGEFAYRTLFDRTFFHIADIVRVGKRYGYNGEIAEASVVKFHRLDFDVGQSVSFLTSPDGATFVLVNRPVGVDAAIPPLAAGWTVHTMVLGAPWRADLFGETRVLRLVDGSSFQGPVNAPGENIGVGRTS